MEDQLGAIYEKNEEIIEVLKDILKELKDLK